MNANFENLYNTFIETPTLSGLKRLTSFYKKTSPEEKIAIGEEKNKKMVTLVYAENKIDADAGLTNFFDTIEELLKNIIIIGNATFKLYKKVTTSIKAISLKDFRREFMAHKEALLLLERIKEQLEIIKKLYADEIKFANKCFSFISMEKTMEEINDFFDSGVINEHGELLERYNVCLSKYDNDKLEKEVRNNEKKIVKLLSMGGKRKNKNNTNKSKKKHITKRSINKNKSRRTYNSK